MTVTVVDHGSITSLDLLLIAFDHNIAQSNQIRLLIQWLIREIFDTLGTGTDMSGWDCWIHFFYSVHLTLGQSISTIECSQHQFFFVTFGSPSNDLIK